MTPIVAASELFDLTGQVALVTGASSGLGERFARVLAAHGAKVVLAARRKERLEALQTEIGDAALTVALDVAEPQAMPLAFDAAEAAFGPVTLLVNNAGITTAAPFIETSAEAWQGLRQVNIDGVWHMAREAARRMIAAGKPGAIINITSILGSRVTKGVSAYCVSKAAVAQMTQAMALELARHQIRVNAIAPGYIVTEMTQDYLSSSQADAQKKAIPMRRVGEPSDLDGPLLLLASPRASAFMTGSTIVADGGHMWSFV